jgi:hypothetical protein
LLKSVKSLKISFFLCSFTKVRAKLILFFFFLNTLAVFAQQEVKGVILDANTKQRVAGVYLYNTSNKEGVFNNLKGEFGILAEEGDVLILAREGYFPDTITVHNQTTLLLNLQRSSIWLKDVHVMARKSPQQALEEKKADYESAYKKGTPGSFLSTGNGGVGLSIDALYSLISREGKNARYLQEIIERDYRDAIIDYRFTSYLVKSLTGLEDKELEDFMYRFRPSYYFILNSNDYALGVYIKNCFKSYERDPNILIMPGLAEGLDE